MRINPAIRDTEFSMDQKVDGKRVGHLSGHWRLPNFLKPAPRPENPTDTTVMLIIVYAGEEYGEYQHQGHLRMGLWNRNAWLVNSDALDYNVDVKLYLEDKIVDTYAETLKENHINLDTDAYIFSAPPIDEKHRTADYQTMLWGHWGKKMVSYFDDQLKGYARIVACDADHMALRPEGAEKLKFFEVLENLPETHQHSIMYGSGRERDWGHFIHNIVNCGSHGFTLAHVSEKVGIDFRQLSASFTQPRGSLWTSPTKWLHENAKHFIDWIRTAAPFMGHDEMVLGIAHDLGHVDVRYLTELGIKMAIPAHHYRERATDTTMAHGRFWRKFKSLTPGERLEAEHQFHRLLGVQL